MILIASAAYVNAEFQIEFGKLPPALLPIGNKRLFEYQIRTLKNVFPKEKIYLSLPDSYVLGYKDSYYLEREGVYVLRSDETLSLAEGIAQALDKSECDDLQLRLLHGDTWLQDLPDYSDCIGIVETNEDYVWEVEEKDSYSEFVWCGYFAFSDSSTFLSFLKAPEARFSHAVREYDNLIALQRTEVQGWHDFGHVNTYFQSRARLTTERAFNELSITDGCVRKTGTPHEKIEAELQWFQELPTELKIYTPQLIDGGGKGGQPYYILEYLPLPPLNEVFVHGKNPAFYWDKIFGLCSNFLKQCVQVELTSEQIARVHGDALALITDKTWQRLDRFIDLTDHPGLDTPSIINGVAVPGLRKISKDCQEHLQNQGVFAGIMHGDFCLSNILFDSRSDRIKVIDPRGLNAASEKTQFGDLRYDLAKLSHSILGLYDFIIAGAFELKCEISLKLCKFDLQIHIDERTRQIQEVFEARRFIGGLSPVDVMPLTILLFLSMLPLHNDDQRRQHALLANALRLYATFMK
ncbi:phosphotransferase [Massilia sp. LXY-6]|uniref:phosphotransferase n=1 Tax=Massilia sp. LXY-6 TaxID=3379823 RepID=UPI003EE14A3D